MAGTMVLAGGYKQFSASGNVSGGKPATLIGIFVSAASATPTLTVYDDPGTGTGTTMVSVFTPTAATFYPLYASANAGLNIVVGGTVIATAIFAP